MQRTCYYYHLHLLLHGLVDAGTVRLPDAAELVDAADAAVSEDQRPGLQVPGAALAAGGHGEARAGNHRYREETRLVALAHLVVPTPVVSTDRGRSLAAYFSS